MKYRELIEFTEGEAHIIAKSILYGYLKPVLVQFVLCETDLEDNWGVKIDMPQVEHIGFCIDDTEYYYDLKTKSVHELVGESGDMAIMKKIGDSFDKALDREVDDAYDILTAFQMLFRSFDRVVAELCKNRAEESMKEAEKSKKETEELSKMWGERDAQ